ncbi:MAG: excinuclease ABC subunit A [Candidatus Melainabacteria bacterium]|nr:excinuclease ABC subunit A [Candidatus Melainabacteria bacterium]
MPTHTETPKKSPQKHTCIHVEQACTHNLHNVTVDIPKHQLVVFTGVSGSGKSSLAFDTIYAEAQRRFMDSLSDYAKQFIGHSNPPPVAWMTGLSPAIAIEQKTASYSPRSTVGTVTEVMDYFRVLFARAGTPHCSSCGANIQPQSPTQMKERLLALGEGTKLQLLAPVVKGRKGEYGVLFHQLRKEGYSRVRVDGEVLELDELPETYKLARYKIHHVEVVIDRIVLKTSDSVVHRLEEGIAKTLKKGEGTLIALYQQPNTSVFTETTFSKFLSCLPCQLDFGEMAPRLFSFNSPYGACPTCQGTGQEVHFNADSLITLPHLSLEAGGIPVLLELMGKRSFNAFIPLLKEALAPYPLPTHLPFTQWTDFEKTLLLYGKSAIETTEEAESEAEGVGFIKPKKSTLEKDPPRLNADTKEAWAISFLAETDEEVASLGELDGLLENFHGLVPLLKARFQSGSNALKAKLAPCFKAHTCNECKGVRLNAFARSVTLGSHGLTMQTLHDYSIDALYLAVKALWEQLSPTQLLIVQTPLKAVETRLKFLLDVGLSYLTLGRRADTLSGGEAQRIRLASQIGSGLVGVLYVLDEPSIGLHPHNNQQLIESLKTLRDKGNSVLVVEHDEEMIQQADWVIDIGPHAGRLGGQLIAEGTAETIAKTAGSVTGQYLAGTKKIPVNTNHRKGNGNAITLKGVNRHNLKNLTVAFPLGKWTTVTGLSGSGKSTLVLDCLYPAIETYLKTMTLSYGRKRVLPEGETLPDNWLPPEGVKTVSGLEHIDKLVVVDQSPIGRTSRSNPATYTGLFDSIRNLYANTAAAKQRGFTPAHFSFNVNKGRCETCMGAGTVTYKMGLLPDSSVPCPVCEGKRYKPEILAVKYEGLNIAELLETPIEQTLPLFESHVILHKQLQVLVDVGLGYLALGQGAPFLSGGEAQRLKLATELMLPLRSRSVVGQTVYLFDEPSVGLHWEDLATLVTVMNRLVDAGHTVIAVEHQLDFIAASDWVIDLGPEAGQAGGQIVAVGTPQKIASTKASLTGHYLHPFLKARC